MGGHSYVRLSHSNCGHPEALHGPPDVGCPVPSSQLFRSTISFRHERWHGGIRGILAAGGGKNTRSPWRAFPRDSVPNMPPMPPCPLCRHVTIYVLNLPAGRLLGLGTGLARPNRNETCHPDAGAGVHFNRAVACPP